MTDQVKYIITPVTGTKYRIRERSSKYKPGEIRGLWGKKDEEPTQHPTIQLTKRSDVNPHADRIRGLWCNKGNATLVGVDEVQDFVDSKKQKDKKKKQGR